MKANELKKALYKADKVFGKVIISPDDSTYVQLTKTSVRELLADINDPNAEFTAVLCVNYLYIG